MRLRMYCALSGTSRPSACSIERTDATACTVVQTPQMRCAKIHASRGSRPLRIVSIPRHIVPEDQAFLTFPPSTSRSMRRCPSMRVTGSMVTRWLMDAPLAAGGGADRACVGVLARVVDHDDGEQPRDEDEDRHADGGHADGDDRLADRGHVLEPLAAVVRGEVGVDPVERAAGEREQRGAEEPALVALHPRREEEERRHDEERELEDEEEEVEVGDRQ